MFFKKDTSLLQWIWLSLACRPGGNEFSRLLKSEKFELPNGVYEASEQELMSVLEKNKSCIPALTDKSLEKAEQIYHYCNSQNIQIIPYGSEHYPRGFLSIDKPPVLIYCKGELPFHENSRSVGIVGTRSMTDYGKRHTFAIASSLAAADIVIVSGMARGIDAVASAAALYAKGKTVVVLGSSIDYIYPPEHAKLANEIAKNGAVISEYPPGYKTMPSCFPIRNRLISALSDALFVAEGRLQSGSLITAQEAQTQGKPIFTLPVSIDLITSEAPRLLLKQGAHIADCADDIVIALYQEYPLEPMTVLAKQSKVEAQVINQVLAEFGIWQGVQGVKRIEKGNSMKDTPLQKRSSDFSGRQETAPKNEEVKSRLPAIDDTQLQIYLAMSESRDMTVDEIQNELPTLDMRTIMVSVSKLLVHGYIKSSVGGRYKRLPREIE